MNLSRIAVGLIVATTLAMPSIAPAQSLGDLNRMIDRRQDKKNEWRNLAYVGGALGAWGLLKGDNTLAFTGAAGALYSAYRYEQDRKSQSRLNRTRAAYFSRSRFDQGGYRYTRRTRWKNGQKYYYFTRAKLRR
ncbi:MAG: hypothetical protein SFX74_05720 [Fimbriimonadaceae bacterium]|nr:hypothetical protein [Fimbriimonadaceae bacterium]